MDVNENNLAWIDLEMTGLNPDCDHIIEIATLITDFNLNVLAEGPIISIYQPDKYLESMDKWNVYTHTNNGLIDNVKNSSINERAAEIETLNFLRKWVPKQKSPICGNSIGKDRHFLFKYMPELESWFHYRYLDVSSIKELAYRWKPEIIKKFKINDTHRARDGVYKSVSELIYYRENFIKL